MDRDAVGARAGPRTDNSCASTGAGAAQNLRRHRFHTVSLTVLLALAAVPAWAQFGGRGGFGGVREDAKILKRYDRNGDGMLDMAERRTALTDFGFDLDSAKATSDAPTGGRRRRPR